MGGAGCQAYVHNYTSVLGHVNKICTCSYFRADILLPLMQLYDPTSGGLLLVCFMPLRLGWQEQEERFKKDVSIIHISVS